MKGNTKVPPKPKWAASPSRGRFSTFSSAPLTWAKRKRRLEKTAAAEEAKKKKKKTAPAAQHAKERAAEPENEEGEPPAEVGAVKGVTFADTVPVRRRGDGARRLRRLRPEDKEALLRKRPDLAGRNFLYAKERAAAQKAAQAALPPGMVLVGTRKGRDGDPRHGGQHDGGGVRRVFPSAMLIRIKPLFITSLITIVSISRPEPRRWSIRVPRGSWSNIRGEVASNCPQVRASAFQGPRPSVAGHCSQFGCTWEPHDRRPTMLGSRHDAHHP